MNLIDADARIGEGTKVWQFASVIRGAVIGKDCSIGSCAIVDGAVIGNGCHIGHGAQIHPGTKICDGVFVGPGAILCNDMWPNCSKKGFAIPKGRWTVLIDDGAVIGARVVVLPGVHMHKGSMAAAGAVVENDVMAFMMIRRNGYVSSMPDNAEDMRMRFAV